MHWFKSLQSLGRALYRWPHDANESDFTNCDLCSLSGVPIPGQHLNSRISRISSSLFSNANSIRPFQIKLPLTWGNIYLKTYCKLKYYDSEMYVIHLSC